MAYVHGVTTELTQTVICSLRVLRVGAVCDLTANTVVLQYNSQLVN